MPNLLFEAGGAGSREGAPCPKPLPGSLARRAARDFRSLGCEEEPLLTAANLLERACPPDAASPLATTFLLLVAAIHAASRFAAPNPPLPSDEPAPPLSPAEWLLIAARERENPSLSGQTAAALDRALELVASALDERQAVTLDPGSPLADYALGTLLPAALGAPEDPALIRAASALGKLTRIAMEMRLITSNDASAPRPHLIGRIASDAGLGPRFALTLACIDKPTPERLPLLTFTASAPLAKPLAAARAKLVEEAIAGFEAHPGEATPAIIEAIRALETRLDRAAAGIRLFGFAPVHPPTTETLERTLTLTRDALREDPDHREAWEIQRWGGFFGATQIARLFPAGLCTLALAEAGEDVQAKAEALLATRRVDGYRYYDNYLGIPPDIDDLGLALQLIALLPPDHAARRDLARPLEILAENTAEDGSIPVWLEKNLEEPVPEGSPTWLGARCIAAFANLLIGLAKVRASLPEGFYDRALHAITREWDEQGAAASYFYAPPYTRFLMAQLASIAAEIPGDPEPREKLRAIVDRIEEDVLREARPDGSYGGVLATACHLGVLALGHRPSFEPWAAITFVAARQDGDGLFPREPFYLGPGKDGLTVGHGARSLTAAVCLLALVAVRARLKR